MARPFRSVEAPGLGLQPQQKHPGKTQPARALIQASMRGRLQNCRWLRKPMTSFRQIEVNRNNALRSTGPKTEAGKRRSRRNAVRHGVTAEIVVVAPEDIENYQALKRLSSRRDDVERELVLRLASLLWRMRRASAIETDLFQIQAEILSDR